MVVFLGSDSMASHYTTNTTWLLSHIGCSDVVALWLSETWMSFSEVLPIHLNGKKGMKDENATARDWAVRVGGGGVSISGKR